jgi:hypothetical protein
VATFVTVRTVPNGRVGLAHIPAGAAAYHVAWPASPSVVRGGVTVVVACVNVAAVARAETCARGGAGGMVVVVVAGGAAGGTVVGVVVGVGVVVES